MPRNEYLLLLNLPVNDWLSLTQVEALPISIDKGTPNERPLKQDLVLLRRLVTSDHVEEMWSDAESCYAYRRRTAAEVEELMNAKY
jgi:hypothetical protein